MDELERIKQEKLAQLQSQLREQNQEEAQLASQIEQMESVVKQKLTKEALLRYGNLKTAHPEIAVSVLAVLFQAIMKQGLQKISDENLKEILTKIQPEKKRFKIKRM